MKHARDSRENSFVHRPLLFIALTFALSWAVWVAGWLSAGKPDSLAAGPMAMAILIGSFAPTLVAAALSAFDGGFREWARGYTRWRIGWRAFFLAILPLPLMILGLTLAFDYIPNVSGEDALPPIAFYATIFPLALLNGLATAIMGAGPLGEEGGWRGYLLPGLLSRFGEIQAALLLGIVWSLWHLPVMTLFADWRGGNSLAFYLLVYTFGTMGLSVFMTRVWLLSGRSLLLMIWIHGIINALGSIAFSADLWNNPWTREVNTFHFALAFWLAALCVILASPRKKSAAD